MYFMLKCYQCTHKPETKHETLNNIAIFDFPAKLEAIADADLFFMAFVIPNEDFLVLGVSEEDFLVLP